MSAPAQPWSRRSLLGGCAACAALAACGAADPAPARGDAPSGGDRGDRGDSGGAVDSGAVAVDDCAELDVDLAGWVEVPLAAHPALAVVGGASVLSQPSDLLELIVVHTAPGCYAAIWRICTHGACPLTWVQAVDAAVCPCHGSQFRADGSLQRGPATVPARPFRVLRRGHSLYIER